MLTKYQSIQEIQKLFVEQLLNNTDEITKVSDFSVFSALSYANSAIAQAAQVQNIVLEANVFPEFAKGQTLDDIAQRYGIIQRFNALGSSTFVFIRAAAGTTYTAGVHTFSGLNGITFNLTETTTIGSIGFAYAPVSSQLSGSQTNIQAATINKVTPEPVGHIYTTNTFAAFGGRDNESDQDFQNRIIQGINALARGTLSSLEQAFVKINPNVLSLRYNGIDNTGKNVIVVVANNGVDFSTNEFDEILTKTKSFFNLSDLGYSGVSGTDNTLIKLVNVDWYYLNLSFRIELEVGASADDVRVLIQQQIQQYLDYRYFPDNGRIEWDDLLVIVRQTTGVRYVFDEYFFLNGTSNDVIVPSGYLPRILNFSMLDAQGSVISDSLGILNPYYLPNPSDLNYLNNVIRGIV